jgi:predicted nuclease of restriction endonuclease-like (RecB) superfamily
MPAKKKTTVTKRRSAKGSGETLDFAALVKAIQRVHEESAAAVNRVVNTTVTLRNWIIGAYIVEYEMRGADRAKYGEKLLDRLAERLTGNHVPSCERRRLYVYRQFFRTYPQIVESLSPLFPGASWIVQSATAQSRNRLETGGVKIVRSVTAQLAMPAETLLNSLSYTHFEQLLGLEDPLKRAFYEIECIRGNWSVRALKRQIATLYFERSGLSKDKEKLAAMVQNGVETAEPKLAIRDPYIFEFLGLRAKDAVGESDLEAALLENLQEFLLELGHGFCLEAQQKSIVIGKTRGFVDLVFYHRILKCHVLVELKVDEFRHEHLGQINTYVTWYRQHMMAEGDNPPVGLLLCTGKDHALVRYATASMDNRLFVSKYAVELPTKEELEKFLHAKHQEIMGNA